jgi:hypothetical protein
VTVIISFLLGRLVGADLLVGMARKPIMISDLPFLLILKVDTPYLDF